MFFELMSCQSGFRRRLIRLVKKHLCMFILLELDFRTKLNEWKFQKLVRGVIVMIIGK